MIRLAARGIGKRFGSVTALDDASLAVRAGEVHALLGENGAGKSTLTRILYGLDRPDRGTVLVDGTPCRFRSPVEARRAGIGMVHQHFTSVPAFTVAENIALARGVPAPRWRDGVVWNDPLVERLHEGLADRAPVESLGVGAKQRLEILKAVVAGQRILLLDEPTAVLTPVEVQDLLDWIRAFARAGGAVVFITHKLDEVMAVAECVTVLRRGRVVLAGALGEPKFSAAGLARAMIGEETAREGVRTVPGRVEATSDAIPGPVVVEARELSVGSRFIRRTEAIDCASFMVRAGEIVGIAAQEGSGERELLHAVAGLLPPRSGDLRVADPVALVPEDRSTEGVIPGMNLAENLLLGAPDLGGPGQWIRWRDVEHRTEVVMQEFDVRAPGWEVPVETLSGGNQQKLVLARAMERHPRVLVVENPTRGLDLHATAAVHRRLRDAAREGVAVLVSSSDLDEVLELADRVLVVARGTVREAVDRRPESIGTMMLGGDRVV